MKNKISINQILFTFTFATLVLTGCKSDVDNEDETGGGSGRTGSNSGGSVIFDGTDEYLTTSDAWYTGDFTICLWMQPDSVAGQTLFSMSAGDKYFYLSFDNNELDWKMESDNDNDMIIDAPASFVVGNLYQVCVTGDHGGTGSRAYVNGSQVGIGAPAALGAAVASAFTTLTIGRDPAPIFQSADGNKTLPFSGSMDHFMIWSTVLPANAISQLYNSGNGLDPQLAFGNYSALHLSQLQVYYLMGDDPSDVIFGGGAVMIDQMGNQNATPVGFEVNDFDVSLW